MIWFQAAYVFIAAFLLGAVYSYYIRRAAGDTHPHQAALSGSALYLLGAVVVISYVGNPWLLIFACTGDYLGTFLLLKWDIKRKRKADEIRAEKNARHGKNPHTPAAYL